MPRGSGMSRATRRCGPTGTRRSSALSRITARPGARRSSTTSLRQSTRRTSAAFGPRASSVGPPRRAPAAPQALRSCRGSSSPATEGRPACRRRR
eukprot:8820671-Lingulodinium_polyedra.AAC.1